MEVDANGVLGWVDVNMCWGIGILISSGVARATITDLSDMG